MSEFHREQRGGKVYWVETDDLTYHRRERELVESSKSEAFNRIQQIANSGESRGAPGTDEVMIRGDLGSVIFTRELKIQGIYEDSTGHRQLYIINDQDLVKSIVALVLKNSSVEGAHRRFLERRAQPLGELPSI
jgi:hypothetical protein